MTGGDDERRSLAAGPCTDRRRGRRRGRRRRGPRRGGPGPRPHAGRLPGPRRAAAPRRRALGGRAGRLGRRAAAAERRAHGLGALDAGAASRSAPRRPACRSSTTSTAFPDKYYQARYPAPPAPELAQRVADLAGGERAVAHEPSRGLDHGAYVPLVAMYPEADVPVLQLSLPTLDPERLLELGARLRPLRDEGVLIVGSGFMTHGLPYLREFVLDAPPPDWSKDFDQWVAAALERRDAGGADRVPRHPVRAVRPSDGRALRPALRRAGRGRARRPHGHADLRLLAGTLQALRAVRLIGASSRARSGAGGCGMMRPIFGGRSSAGPRQESRPPLRASV